MRIAGVEVGKVSAVTLHGNHAQVSFSVDTSQHLTTTTKAAIHFENLLGQRFLAILPGAPAGKPLQPGGVIPISQTTPALDLTAVFDGFQPLFSALAPGQVNQLAGSIIEIFQGESGTVSNLVRRPPVITNNLADRQQVIDGLLDEPVEPAQHRRRPRHPARAADRQLRHPRTRPCRIPLQPRHRDHQRRHPRDDDEQPDQRVPADLNEDIQPSRRAVQTLLGQPAGASTACSPASPASSRR